MRALALSLGLSLLPLPAAAICEGTGSNVEYKNCVGARADTAEAELDAVLEKVMREVYTRDYMEVALRQLWATRMRAGQRAWAAFVEIECRENTGFEWWGGSGAGGAISLCRYNKTAARVRDLVARYNLDTALAPVSMDSTD